MYLAKCVTLCVSVVAALSVTGDATMTSPGVADRVVAYKADRTLQLFRGDEIIAEYPIRLGGNPAGHKQQRGDERTPEGLYTIDWRNPESRFYLSLHVSYPNAHDRTNAAARGVSPGGNIMIHGQPNSRGWGRGWPYFINRFRDWTDGCISVSNADMREIWHAVPDGTPVEINP